MDLNRKRDLNVCCVYKLTAPDNKIYIGQTTNLYRRKISHRNMTCVDQPLLYQSFKKHGVGKHSLEILKKCKKEKLNALEIYYIALYNSFDSTTGLNLQAGGLNGKASKQTKTKMKTSGKGRIYTKIALKNLSRAGVRVSVPVFQYTKDNVFIKKWPSMLAAAKGVGLKTGTSIHRACKNGTSGGFKWKRKK